MLEFRADEKTAEKLTEIADTLDISRSDLLLSMVKFALTNHQWARFGLTHKTLPRYEENPIMATKKFSPAQIAAQKLFAERARAGTLGKTAKRNPVKKNPVTETLIYGLAPGETRDYMEVLIYGGGQKLTQAQIDKVIQAASKDGFHSFRIAGFDPTIKPDFAAAVRRKRNPDKAKPRAYVKRASQATGAPPSKRLVTRRKKALTAPAGYFPNPMMTAAQVQRVKQALKESETALSRATRYSPENQDKGLIDFYQKHIAKLRKSMETGKFPSDERFGTGQKTNPAAAMMTGYQVICMHPKKHVVGVFKTMAEAKQIATAMANAKGVAYAVKTVKVHKAHFAA
jgi:hypothetical protein